MSKKRTTYDVSKIHLLHISITKSNLKLSLTEPTKNLMLFWTTLGASGYRNDQCNSYIATREMSEKLGKKIIDFGLKSIGLYMKGVTRWKGVFIRGLLKIVKKSLVRIAFIRDLTPIPFNGCSPQAKARRRRRRKKKYESRRFKKEFILKSKFSNKLKKFTKGNI